jgi:hypothetical protein
MTANAISSRLTAMYGGSLSLACVMVTPAITSARPTAAIGTCTGGGVRDGRQNQADHAKHFGSPDEPEGHRTDALRPALTGCDEPVLRQEQLHQPGHGKYERQHARDDPQRQIHNALLEVFDRSPSPATLS